MNLPMAFQEVVDALLPHDASTAERLLVAMAFDTPSAVFFAAHGAPIPPDVLLAAAHRASLLAHHGAVTAFVTRSLYGTARSPLTAPLSGPLPDYPARCCVPNQRRRVYP